MKIFCHELLSHWIFKGDFYPNCSICTLKCLKTAMRDWLVYKHDFWGKQCPSKSADISVKAQTHPCYIYVIVMYSIAHNYQGIATLPVRYVLYSKMLPYWSVILEAEEKIQWLILQTIMLYWLWRTSEDLSLIPSMMINC